MADILKRFPKEIEDLINEFNADHRGRFYETLKRIPLYRSFDSIHHCSIGTRALKLTKIYDEQCFETGNYDFEKVIRENVDDIDRFLTVYSRCSCCTTHTQKKCIKVTEPKSHYVRSIVNFNQGIDCSCNCHIMLDFMNNVKHNRHSYKDRYSTAWHNFYLVSDDEGDEDIDDQMSIGSF